jgi:hypothetical protein
MPCYAAPAVPVKCCRSNPRCRDCPARKIEDDRLLLALGLPPGPPLPPHLRGLPQSLHKYEPLLRKAWIARVERIELARDERLELELVGSAGREQAAA